MKPAKEVFIDDIVYYVDFNKIGIFGCRVMQIGYASGKAFDFDEDHIQVHLEGFCTRIVFPKEMERSCDKGTPVGAGNFFTNYQAAAETLIEFLKSHIEFYRDKLDHFVDQKNKDLNQ